MSEVALAEISAAMGVKVSEVEAECRSLGLAIQKGWDGRPAVAVNDARGLVDGSIRRGQEHERAWAAHQADNKRWVAGRTAAAREAAEEAHNRLRQSASSAEQLGARQRAALAALIKYEKRIARPVWSGNGKPTIPLDFLDRDGVPA